MYALLRVLDFIPKDVENHLKDLNRNVTGSDSYFKNYSDMAFFTSDWSFFMLLKKITLDDRGWFGSKQEAIIVI